MAPGWVSGLAKVLVKVPVRVLEKVLVKVPDWGLAPVIVPVGHNR